MTLIRPLWIFVVAVAATAESPADAVKQYCTGCHNERLKTGVAVACLTRYQNLIQHRELRAHGIYYFVPNLLNHFDTESIVALIAPRSVLFQTGDQDAGSPVDGVRAIESAVRPVYRLYGKEPNFQSIIYPGLGHVYTQEMWNQTLAWLQQRLNEESD